MNGTHRAALLSTSICLAVIALAGCTTTVPGRPTAAAGFVEPAFPATPQSRSGEATQDEHPPLVRIPHPRDLRGIDPCSLLTPQDLIAAGGGAGPARPGTPTPDACSFPLRGAPGDAAAAGFHDQFREARARQPQGIAAEIEGYSAWLYCEVVDDYQTCSAVTAVRPDRTLLTLLSKHRASAADTSDALYRLTLAALRRLPPA